MADLTHRSSRTIDQAADVVHDRLLELAERLRTEAPPIPPASQASMALGVDGPLGIELADRGPGRIDLRTTRGRIRAEATATITSRPDGRTDLAVDVVLKPQGFVGNMTLAAILGGDRRRMVEDALERGFDDLAAELAKPDSEWDASAWQPPGVTAPS